MAACLMLQTRVSVRPSVAETLSGAEECLESLFRSSSRLNDCDLIKEARIWEDGGGVGGELFKELFPCNGKVKTIGSKILT